jgi:tRNA threonylcarbamoyl adenosine modification protein (Sua5/YciO/YrdC/YwlC family)
LTEEGPSWVAASDPGAIELSAETLGQGLVVALPTDTVYGLAVDPSRPHAVERLFALKERPREVAIPVLIGAWEQAQTVAGRLDGAADDLAERYWPGPLTLVVPRWSRFTVDLGGTTSARRLVGVRWPDHPFVQLLSRTQGPLAVTSANRHGAAPATTAEAVGKVFAEDGALAAIVDGGVCEGLPSTVVECRGEAVRCLRDGAVPWGEIVEHRPRGSWAE